MQPTIGKAGAIILSSSGNATIVLLYRGKHKDWSFPKGHIEAGEDAPTAMLREIKEETGLAVTIISTLSDMNYQYQDGSYVSVKMYLVRATNDSALRPEKSGDIVTWVPIDRVIETLSYANLKEYFTSVLSEVKAALKTST